MPSFRALPACLALLVFSFVAAPVLADQSRSPSQVVETFHAHLLETMKAAESLDVKARFERLAGPMDEAFDFTTMIRVAATRQFWNGVDDGQRQKLLEGFRRLSIATYAAQFDGYSGQRFETVGERPGPQGTVLVATRIVEPDGSGVGLTYVLRKDNGGAWLIADVLLDDSISQLAVRRSEYKNILEKSGVSGLVAEFEDKSAKILRSN